MITRFSHAPDIWADFPQLVPGVMVIRDVSPEPDLREAIAALSAEAASRLAVSTESELPEVQAWRKAFTQMGLKPTQYRCASESLLRRFRKEGSLPRLHPLVDLCNAASLAYALPVAAFDADLVSGDLTVRYARGDEDYLSFAGAIEHPDPREVVFADDAGHAHARRWTHRQSRLSAVSSTTTTAFIITEALHDTGSADVRALGSAFTASLPTDWKASPTKVLARDAPTFDGPA